MALQGEGIACQLDGEGQAGLSDILEIGVLVPAKDADRARRIIEHNEARHERAALRRHVKNHNDPEEQEKTAEA
jgi:hypothetical protein